MANTTEIKIMFQNALQSITIEFGKNRAEIQYFRFFSECESFQIYSDDILEKFYDLHNDRNEYGCFYKGQTDAQKINIFKRIILDALECFDKLLNKFSEKGIYRYAKWYCNRYEKIENLREGNYFGYSEYITYKTCSNITEYSFFILEDDEYELTEF